MADVNGPGTAPLGEPVRPGDADVHLRQLQAFGAVVKHGSVGAAALALRTSQPGLSRLLVRLEARLGVKLFERSRRGMTLTAPGAALLPAARRVLDALHAFGTTVDAVVAGEVGLLRVGTTEGAGALITETLRRFRRRYPQVEVRLEHGHTPAKLAALRAGRLDAAFVRKPGTVPGVGLREVAREPLVAVLAVDHPLAARPEVSLQALVEHPLLLTPERINRGVHEAVLALLDQEGLCTSSVTPTTSDADAVAVIATSDHWMLLGRSTAAALVGPVLGVPLTNQVAQVSVTLAWRLNGSTPAIDGFRQAAAEAGRSLSRSK